MQLKHFVDMYALGRQISIRDRRYQDAMTNHFMFYMYLDEYQNIKEKLSAKDMTNLIKAMICIDHK
jgi:hypothetical protein